MDILHCFFSAHKTNKTLKIKILCISLFAKPHFLASVHRFVSEQTSVLLTYVCLIGVYFVSDVYLSVFTKKVANTALYKAWIAV